MKYILSLLFSICLLHCFAQDAKKEVSILYVVDSIPIIDDPDKSSGTLKNEDVDHLDVITDPQKINAAGYTTIDKIIYITTKEYLKRPEEIKKIPTTKLMVKKDGVWYLKNSTAPYSGPFIDYYLSGKKQGEGIFNNGVINGLRTIYYENGNKDFFRNYINGIENGYSEEYFINGSLKQKGSFKDGKDDGLWIEYYSTGVIKRQMTYLDTKPTPTKSDEKFYPLLAKAEQLMQDEDYKGAIKDLDEAEKLNNNYADLYFDRGTAKLNNLDFDNAVIDFNKAIALEPLYMEAFGNRAFARIRKYEFKNSRTISNNAEVTILATKDKVDIPDDEKTKICSDLNKSVELGDDKDMIFDAIKTYCSPPTP
jgi:antitoxin component YwqK of YwqJK toxin-antitoxin module